MMPPESVGRDILNLSFKTTASMFPGCVLSLRCVAKLGSTHWQHQRWALLNSQHTYAYPNPSYSGMYFLFFSFCQQPKKKLIIK